MPFSFRLDPETSCLVVKWIGHVSSSEVHQFFRLSRDHPSHRSGLNRIHDFREATVEMSPDEATRLEYYAADQDQYLGERRVAFLTPKELSGNFRLLLNTLAIDRNADIQFFEDAETAAAWVGLPPEDVPAADK